MPYHAQALAEFLGKLKIKRPIVVGHSLGGHISVLLSSLVPVSGLMIFQAPPLETVEDLGKAFNPIEGLGSLFTDQINEVEVKALMKGFFGGKASPPFIFESFKATDPLCRKNVAASLTPDYRVNEVTNLNKLKAPIAILDGKKDGLINQGYLSSLRLPKLWRDQIIALPDDGHYPQLENPKKFNSLLGEFVAEISQG